MRLGYLSLAVGASTLLMLAGCPQVPYIPGTTGTGSQIGSSADVTVYSPSTPLQINGGSLVEVTWKAQATTSFALLDVIFDPDKTPDNGNETVVLLNVPLSQQTALVDTSSLSPGTYNVGVRLYENDELTVASYAPGAITINGAVRFFFTSPRANFTFDRTTDIAPRFDVTWTLGGTTSGDVEVNVYLDADTTRSGDEFLLYTSTSPTGDSFSFNLPTSNFEPGTYSILARVRDGTNERSFIAPGSIRLRERLAGLVDLRNLGALQAPVPGAIFTGANPRDGAGSFVTSLRDLDNDGFGDFLLVSQFGKPLYQVSDSRVGVGEGYLVYGRSNRFSGEINLNSTGTLFRGDIYTGPPEVAAPIRPSRGMSSVALLSDWDGDGVREIAFGVPFNDSAPISPLATRYTPRPNRDAAGYFRAGAVVIAAGSSLRPDLGFPGGNVFNLGFFGNLPHEAFTTTTCPEAFVGAKAPAPSGPFYRHTDYLANSPPPSPLPFGGAHLGCRFSAIDDFSAYGESVSSYAFDSIIVSCPNGDPANAIETVAGSIPSAGYISVFFCPVSRGFYPWSNVSAPAAGNGYAGSVQSNGLDTLPHGGPYNFTMDDTRVDPTSFIPLNPGYFLDRSDSPDPGCERVWATQLQVSTRFWTSTPSARLSNAVGLDDVNGDGLQDFAIGAPFMYDGAGACFLVLGRLRDLVENATLQLEELGLPSNGGAGNVRVFDGIRIVGDPGTRLGQSQASAGDFNRDGLPDALIGSPLLNARKGGAAVFFGSRDVINLTDTEIQFNQIADRGLGVVFVGQDEGDLAGARVAGIGDVDGDGNDDILIAAPEKSVTADLNGDGIADVDRTGCGVVYLIYGSPNLRGTISLADIGTERLPGAMFVGRNSGDHIGAGTGQQGDISYGISSAGDVDGDGKSDLLIGSVSASPRDRVEAGEAYLIYGR